MRGIAQQRENLATLRREVLESVEDLTDDQINSTPPGLQNSVGIILRHLVGSERWWIHKMVGSRPFERNRDAEFGHDRLAKSDLVAAMKAAGEETDRILAEVSPSTLAEEFESVFTAASGGTRRYTKEYAILHTVEHYAYHHGQIRVYRRLVRG